MALSFEERIEARIRADENEDLIARLRAKAMDSVVHKMLKDIAVKIADGASTYGPLSAPVAYECDHPADTFVMDYERETCRYFRFETPEELEIIRARLEIESKGCAACRVITGKWNSIECDLRYERPEFPKPLVDAPLAYPKHSRRPMERGAEL